jgi:uncharacterized membrane protein YdbT with pleckstrin-like domain
MKMASYIEQILEPGEQIRQWAHLHWFTYVSAWILLMIVGAIVGNALASGTLPAYAVIVPLLLLLLAFAIVLRISTTEIAVTNRRVIKKTGLIARTTRETNISKIESVDVAQSILGRMFGYATVAIRGTGIGHTSFDYIADPLSFRRAILSN